MEFRKCPGCQASVLDDDAADCPFCGVSMSGKPSSGKPSSAPPKAPSRKTPAKTSGKSAAKRPAGPQKSVDKSKDKPKSSKSTRASAAEKPDLDDDADPFDVDTSVIAQAPPVARKPAKGRMIRVVCPMCETPGFISPKMRGRDVKCCNKDCLVPVYKAPAPEKKEEPEEESSKLFSMRNLTIGLGVVVLMGLGLVWYFVIRDAGPKEFVPGQSRTADNSSETISDEPEDAVVETLSVEQKVSLADLKRQALDRMVSAARLRDGNRSKPYCRRMSAEAFAQSGDVAGAREQLSRLKALTKESFYTAEPLAAIAWQQRAGGDSTAASQTTTEAFEAAVHFPGVGRAAPSAASAVAAVLATDDRIDDAKEVFRRLDHDDDATLSRERVAALVQITYDLEMFDLDRMLRYSSLDMAVDPLGTATAIAIAAGGYWDRAIAWAMQADDVAAREDGMSAVAMVAARQAVVTEDESAVISVKQAAQQLSTTGQSRVASGLATGSLMQGDKDAALAALAEALTLFESIKRTEAVPRPDVRSIVDGSRRPDAAPLRSAAVGAAQMARLQVLLGDTEAAWTTLLKAWEFTHGIGPEAATTFKLVNEIASNQGRAEQRVKREMGISDRDLLSRTFRKYRRNARDVGHSATERFELEVDLLREAIGWGLLNQVSDMMQNPEAVSPTAAGQTYAMTSLPSTLERYFETAGNTAMVKEMAAIAKDNDFVTDRIAKLIAEAEIAFRSDKTRDAARALGAFTSSYQNLEQRRDLLALQLACRLLKRKQPQDLFAFILALKDQELMDDCFELTSALSVRHGLAPDLWELHQNQRMTPTQRVAFYRGLIAGIVAVE